VLDSHLNGYHRLGFYAHGPEWAFVVPHGDWEALTDVIRVCSRVWNGSGALILTCDQRGRLRGNWKPLVDSRALDLTWLHPSLGADTRAALVETQAALSPVEWGSGFGFRALHPAELIDAPAQENLRHAMTIPRFASAALQRVAEVSWGVVEHEDEWADRFDVGAVDGDLAFMALLGGQLGFNMVSPLLVSQISMPVLGRWDGEPWPYLWIFETGSFDELVAFWNFRTAADANNRFASVIGVPREALLAPESLEALRVWSEASTGPARRPTFLVKVAARREPVVDAALATLGIERAAVDRLQSHAEVTEDEPPTWLPRRPVVKGRFIRGVRHDGELYVKDGRGDAQLPKPRGYRPGGGASLVIQTMPVPLPITPTAATRMMHGSFAHPRGLGINMGSASPWSLAVSLPDSDTALRDWATDHGYGPEEPRAGKDARALLQRLGDLDRLDALVDETRIEVLAHLAPLSRDQLVKRLAKRFATRQREADLATDLAETLREDELLMELPSKTAAQLASATARKVQQVVAALGPLVEVGFVHRGRNVACPQCRFPTFLALRELDERVRCRACGHDQVLPVMARDGGEAPLAYRVDGLMARVMDQHVLPVVLALRALRDPSRFGRPDYAWPGMLFREADQNPFDIDLLTSDGTTVHAAECKLDARGLGRPQLRTLLRFTDRVGARPVVAAMAGEFAAETRRAIERRDGLVLQRSDMLTIGERPDFA